MNRYECLSRVRKREENVLARALTDDSFANESVGAWIRRPGGRDELKPKLSLLLAFKLFHFGWSV